MDIAEVAGAVVQTVQTQGDLTVNVTHFAIALISLATAVLTTFIIPWIKSHTTINQQTAVSNLVTALVNAAEITMRGRTGQEKLDQVKKWLEEKHMTVDAALIESAVHQLKVAGQSLSPPVIPPSAENPTTAE